MLLLLRKIKHSFFVNDQFRKYLAYAVGEMVLVVIGILIALQIDNWNNEQQREEILSNYLAIIADNIRQDLENVVDVRAARESAYELASRWRYFGSRDGSYTAEEVRFAGRTFIQASKLHYLNVTDSGYQALKSSGNLDRLKGRGVESLLFDYYDTLGRIQSAERSHNEYVSDLWLQVLARWPTALDPWHIADPALIPHRVFKSLQPHYEQLFNHPTTWAILRRAESTGTLIMDYERLEMLGNALIVIVNSGAMAFDEATRKLLDEMYDPRSGIGYPDVISEGQIAFQGYYPGSDNSISYEDRAALGSGEQKGSFHLRSFEKEEDALHIDYEGGADWAGLWYLVGTNLTLPEHRDYSKFDTLVLELKGDRGGETVFMNLEDWEDPRDGSSTRIALELTDDWRTYEIDLDRFETADLQILQSLGFIFQREPQSFSVRTLRFAKSE